MEYKFSCSTKVRKLSGEEIETQKKSFNFTEQNTFNIPTPEETHGLDRQQLEELRTKGKIEYQIIKTVSIEAVK